MQQFIRDHLAMLESDDSIDSRTAALRALRPLGLNDFASLLWQAPLQDFPRLSRHLPPMSSEAVQKQWTGNFGDTLLSQSLPFVQSAAQNFASLTGRSLNNARILDFGCGYGRYLRLFSYFSDEVWGCDPWESSIAESRAAGFSDRVRKSEQIPATLPVDGMFEFAFAFSVFTHLNAQTALAALRALRGVVAPDGILCITVRAPEYWMNHAKLRNAAQGSRVAQYVRLHNETGFAFVPHGPRPDDPQATFGDASMTLDWLATNAKGWRIEAVDRSLTDPMQRYLYLRGV